MERCERARHPFPLGNRKPDCRPPSYDKPYIYVGTVSGEVFAIDESTGVRQWKFATGYPVTRALPRLATKST